MEAKPTEPINLSEIRLLRGLKEQAHNAYGEFRLGQRHGPWLFTYSSGIKWQEGEYRHGLRQGHWTIWGEDGRLASFGEYLDGRRHGRWVFCLGNRRAICIYCQGSVIGLRISQLYPTCS